MPNALSRELLAEFFGTFILIVFGVGVVAQVVLSKGAAGSTLSINIAWGLAVTMGCYVAAGVTGAHLNPAVTLALAVHRRFPWNKVLPYSLAQLAGAFIASAVVFVTYHEALNAFDSGVRQVVGPQGTAGIWATHPQPFLSVFPGGFIDQVVGTARWSASSSRSPIHGTRRRPPGWRRSSSACWSSDRRHLRAQCGARHQPCARFRPRLFTFVAGWGGDVFRAGNGWWWVPIVAPCVGGVAGGWAYDFFVGSRFQTAV
jgi:aquaporin-10